MPNGAPFEREAAGEMHLGRFGGAIGRGAGRRRQAVLRTDEDDGAANSLVLHDAVAGAGGQEITCREDRDVPVPKLQRRVLERRRRGDAGVGDQDIEAAVGEQRLAETRRRPRPRSVTSIDDPDRDILAEALAEVADCLVQALGVDVGEDDACAFAHHPLGDRPADAARPAGNQRYAACERLGLRHALKLRLLQQPILDIERLLLVEPDVRADARRPAHDVDGVAVEFRRDPGGRLVLGEGQHADAGNEIDDGVGIAHRRRVRPLAAVVIGGIVGAVGRQVFVERRDDGFEIVAAGSKGSTSGRILVRRK